MTCADEGSIVARSPAEAAQIGQRFYGFYDRFNGCLNVCPGTIALDFGWVAIDLVIARDYMTTGIRERAAELVDLDLGPRTHREIAQTLRVEVEQERLTSIDRALLKGMDAARIVATNGRDAAEQTLRAARLAKLSRLGLAEPLGAGRFRLVHDLADTLRALGERGDIIRTMQRDFSRAATVRAPADRSSA